MQFLCNMGDFKEAVAGCAALLEEDALRRRGLQEIPTTVRLCRDFLLHISTATGNSYEELLQLLQRTDTGRKFLPLAGFGGKLLDATQILKPHTARSRRVRESIGGPLRRTGHEFAWTTLDDGTRHHYEQELLEGTATYQLLEVAALVNRDDLNQGRNPISTLRNSMGARLPEEYFSELLAGWVAEDFFKSFLEGKGLACLLEGPDRERRIQFSRPTEMGVYDLRISNSSSPLYLELQRVGKLSRDTRTGTIKTYLRSHKYEGGNGPDKVLILWVGVPHQNIYKSLAQRLVLISNVRNKSYAVFKDDCIYLPLEVFSGARTWAELQGVSGGELVRLLNDS